MARKRRSTPMELIGKTKLRQATFEKRKRSLKKAAHELSTLCGVGVGMIVCGEEGPPEAEAWPPGPDAPVARITKLYRTGLGQDGICNRVYGVAEYFKEKREKVEEQIKKMREESFAKWEEEHKESSEESWRELDGFLKAKIASVREKIASVRALEQQQQQWGYLGARDYIGSFEGSRNVCPDTKFWVDPLIQGRESQVEMARQHQNPALYEAGRSAGYQDEGTRRMATTTMMNGDGASCSKGVDDYTFSFNQNGYQNPGMLQTGVEPLMPFDMANDALGYQDEGTRMMMTTMMVNGDGASCSKGVDDYTYFLNQDGYQNPGMLQTGVEPLMLFDVPNDEDAVLQSWQGMMEMNDLPEWGMQTEMMGKVDGVVEPLMSYDMPNEETRVVQNQQGVVPMTMSAPPETQTTQGGYYVGK